MALRRSEGCLTVEMETAAFCAVAQFRGVTFGQILYGGDDLTGENWDGRSWQKLTSTGKNFIGWQPTPVYSFRIRTCAPYAP